MSLELDVLWNERNKQITTENVQLSWKRGIIPNPLFNNNPKWIILIRDVGFFVACNDTGSSLYKLELKIIFPAQRKPEKFSVILLLHNMIWRQDNSYELV